MKKITFVFALFIFLLFFSSAYAHSPADMKINFDPATKMLNVEVTHNTNNPAKHYIERVYIWVRNKKIIEQEISRQDNNQTQTVVYFIPDAKPEDIISVGVYCSVNGRLERNNIADKKKRNK